jgi:hypothetical protein
MKNVTLSGLLVGVGGAITFLFSFLDFAGESGYGFNAWDTDAFAFATTLPAVLGLVAAVWVGLEIAGVKLPDEVLTFNAAQLKATWGIAAAGIMLSWFSANENKAAGFWLMLLGSLAMAVGAILSLSGVGNDPLTADSGSTSREDPPPPSTPPAAPPPANAPSATPAPPTPPPAVATDPIPGPETRETPPTE